MTNQPTKRDREHSGQLLRLRAQVKESDPFGALTVLHADILHALQQGADVLGLDLTAIDNPCPWKRAFDDFCVRRGQAEKGST